MNELNPDPGRSGRLEISELKKQIGKYETLLSQLKNSIKDGIVELNPITLSIKFDDGPRS